MNFLLDTFFVVLGCGNTGGIKRCNLLPDRDDEENVMAPQ
jgi:hypothetical protein